MSEESFAQMLDNEEWKEIRTGEVVDGTVIAVKPDKIVLNIGGKSDGIITRSEYTSAPDVDLTTVVSDTFVKDLSVYNGKEVTFVITEYDPKNRKIIGDCKQLIVAAKKAAAEAVLSKIKEGDTIEGTVKNVTDFGAFIDLGGVDGLLHISEMSWGRTENPKKVYKIGDSVKCFIKEINGDKIALSVKYPDLNPWNNAAEKYAVGNVVKGTVARMTDFGAFVQLEDGFDALLHVSQISRERIEKPSDALSIGQEIEAKVVDLNEADKKISLSIKALLNDNEAQEEAPATEE